MSIFSLDLPFDYTYQPKKVTIENLIFIKTLPGMKIRRMNKERFEEGGSQRASDF